MGKRFKFGPTSSPFRIVSPAPSAASIPGVAPASPGQRRDVEIGLAKFALADSTAVATVAIPPYDLGTFNRLLAIHAVILPRDKPLPENPEDLIGSGAPEASADVSAQQVGATVPLSLDLSSIPGGTICLCQTVLEIETPDPAPASATTAPDVPATSPATPVEVSAADPSAAAPAIAATAVALDAALAGPSTSAAPVEAAPDPATPPAS